jgi:hypothetical protein
MIRQFFLILAILLIVSMESKAASTEPRFEFSISGDRFKLKITQDFKTTIAELRKSHQPELLPLVSNIVRNASIEELGQGLTRLTIRTSKRGYPSWFSSLCKERSVKSDWIAECELDLETGNSGQFFKSAHETIVCTNGMGLSRCEFTMDAELKPLNMLVYTRTPEELALAGIVERIHDQAVLGRIINKNEKPSQALSAFEDSKLSKCLNQIYKKNRNNARKMGFESTPLEIQSTQWDCH